MVNAEKRNIPEFFDDCWHEQAERIQRQSHSMERCAIKPDFIILDGVEHWAPSEPFRAACITIAFEAGLDQLAVFVAQKGRGLRVVCDECITGR